MRLGFALAVLFLASTHASALTVTMTATVEGEEKPVIVGKTNLPDGIDLMITVRRKESQYSAQVKTKVKGGTFRAGPFSQGGVSLNPGNYTVEVMTPVAAVQ